MSRPLKVFGKVSWIFVSSRELQLQMFPGSRDISKSFRGVSGGIRQVTGGQRGVSKLCKVFTDEANAY